MGINYGPIAVGAEKKLYLVTFSPNGERALVAATSRNTVAAMADEIARSHRIKRTGADIGKASKDDIEKGGFVAISE